MNRTFLFATPVLAAVLVGAGAVRVQGQQPAANPEALIPVATPVSVSPMLPAQTQPKPEGQTKAEGKVPARLSGDQAYRANCTRCHSELPKLAPRAMKTVLMHMRVRANITEDEARAIVDYLTR